MGCWRDRWRLYTDPRWIRQIGAPKTGLERGFDPKLTLGLSLQSFQLRTDVDSRKSQRRLSAQGSFLCTAPFSPPRKRSPWPTVQTTPPRTPWASTSTPSPSPTPNPRRHRPPSSRTIPRPHPPSTLNLHPTAATMLRATNHPPQSPTPTPRRALLPHAKRRSRTSTSSVS